MADDTTGPPLAESIDITTKRSQLALDQVRANRAAAEAAGDALRRSIRDALKVASQTAIADAAGLTKGRISQIAAETRRGPMSR